MVVILEPGFETVTNWTYEEVDTNSKYSGFQSSSYWKTEGSYSYVLLAQQDGGDFSSPGDYLLVKQTITIPSNFIIVVDLRCYGSSSLNMIFEVLIDSSVVWTHTPSSGYGSDTIFLNQTIDLSAYAGSGKVLKFRMSINSGSAGGSSGFYFIIDNIREGLIDIYVDINKADDTGSGVSFATAKKTMKAAWDILLSTGTMHVASGDYSAQTTIAYNKSWKLSPEDPNTTGAKNVKIPKST